MKKSLAVLFGGCSSEYEVSLHSAAAVLRAVDTDAYDVVMVGITRMGQWLYYTGGIDAIEADAWHRDPGCVRAVLSPSREDHGLWLMREEGCELKTIDLCLPVLHGKNGEDGTVQGLLELAGIPVVGCGSLASALCMDKDIAHRLAMQAGIDCPRFTTVFAGRPIKDAVRQTKEAMGDTPLPWFVKPAREGSSFGVVRLEKAEQLQTALETAFQYGDKVVVEEGISGFEVGCAVLGGPNPTTGQVDAIRLAGGFFDFHEKYNLESAKILVPAPLDEQETNRVKRMALALYALFGCAGFARVDMFYTPQGRIVFNEINTIPGMTDHSRYPGMLAAAGLPFKAMVAKMLEQAVRV